jgi:single-strand DNA-binding protein
MLHGRLNVLLLVLILKLLGNMENNNQKFGSTIETGELHYIGETETTASGFSKRVLVISEQNGDYTNYIAFELQKDRCSVADGLKVGDTVTAHLNLRSRDWQGRWFTNLTCWKIEAKAATYTPPPALPIPPATQSEEQENGLTF